jgi:hypothetical protein
MLGFGESDAMEDQDEEEEGDEEQIDQFGVMIQDMQTEDEGEERIIKHKPDEKPSKKKVGAADDIYDL